MEFKIYHFMDRKRLDELRNLYEKGLCKTTKEYWENLLFPEISYGFPELYVAENDEGKIVAMSTLYLLEYADGVKGAYFADWVSDSDFRGCGLIRKIFNYIEKIYKEQNCDFMMAYSPNEFSYPILKKFGFCDKPTYSYNTISVMYKKREKRKNVTNKNISYKFYNEIPYDFEIPLKNERLIRTSEFLKWKYPKKENFRWLVIEKENEILGYFVYRIAEGRFRTVVNICDFDIFKNDYELFVYSIKLLKKEASYVSLWGVYDEPLKEWFRKAGMKKSKDKKICVYKSLRADGKMPELMHTRADTDIQ